jgi:hypothetical protein
LPAGEQGFADTASRSRSQPKMEDNLFTSPYGRQIKAIREPPLCLTPEVQPNAQITTNQTLFLFEFLTFLW